MVPLATVDDRSVPVVPSVKAATLVTVPPVPVAEMEIAPDVFEMLTPLPAVRVVRVKPLPLPMSSAPLTGVDDRPVPPLATGSVPDTWLVRLTPDNAPPSVSEPLVVTVPVSVMPFTVPVPLTLVTEPLPLPLNVVQSVLVK